MVIGLVAGILGAVAGRFGGAKARACWQVPLDVIYQPLCLKMQWPLALQRSLSFNSGLSHYALDNLLNKILAAEYQMVLDEETMVDELVWSETRIAKREKSRST